jgi:hypothetical protein
MAAGNGEGNAYRSSRDGDCWRRRTGVGKGRVLRVSVIIAVTVRRKYPLREVVAFHVVC